MSRITEDTIRRIKYAANIEEVVGDFVSLKRKGQNLMACCPFHNEKTPSFTVSPAKGIYKCFGCGAAGDSVKFVMDVEGLTYPEALRYLANKYHIEVEEEQAAPELQEQRTQREALLIALGFAKNYYKDLLFNDPDGKAIGLTYFHERGFDDASIQTFELGYSRPGWNDLETEAVKKNYSPDILEKAGLLVQKEEGGRQKRYDRFRGRVMFPIHDLAGKVVGFGARTMKKDEQPKYLNSPETEVYHKSEVLYGIFQAKNAIRQADNAYLVEGYTDVVAMHQAGVANVVASSGTSLTEGQIRLIRRFTDHVTVLYDGDPAGIKASMRGIDLLLAEGLNVRALLFPEGEDPDSYIKKHGARNFQAFLPQHTQDFLTFKTQLLLRDAPNDPLQRAKVIHEVVNSIAKIPDAIKREVYTQQCSRLLTISEDTLMIEVNKALLKAQQQATREREARERTGTGARPPVAAPQTDQEVPLPSEEPYPGGYPFPPDELAFLDEAPLPDELPLPEGVVAAGSFSPKIHQLIEGHERECVRLLLRFGTVCIDAGEDTRLWQYLFAETQDIEFHTPVYRSLLEMYKNAILEGMEPDADYFINRGAPEIVERVINLTVDRWVVSENWEKKYAIQVPQEQDHVLVNAHDSILRLKRQFVEKLEAEVLQQLAEAERANQEAEVQRLIYQHQHLAGLRVSLAKPLGSIVSARHG
jgi:DNA primase